MIDSLRGAIRERREEMARFLAELVEVPTENPPGREYRRGLDVVARLLDEHGLGSTIEPAGESPEPECPRYWLRSDWGTGERAVYFHGHIDVVPAQDASQFEPRVTDETIFGRGSTDMKGGLVSMIFAIRALADCGVRPDGRIALRVVPDEETGGALGSETLRRDGRLFAEDACAMLTAEPTGGIVWNASRGALTYRLRVKGRTSHVGLQYRGVNAFENMLVIANELASLKKEVEARSTGFAIEPEAAGRSILMIGGETRGEANFNVVPASFSFTVDRRINPEEDFDEEKSRLLDVFDTARRKGVDFDVETIQEARPAGVASDHPAAGVLADSILEARGESPRFELCPGILETRFYAERGVPAFAYGPGLLSVAHGPNEFVKRRDLEECALAYAIAAVNLLR
jgi:acetylornithine deacetylase/succinyl-diaminopimelate desuccinylase family protein